MSYTHDIKGLHHNAYRCDDSERTRQFYEDFLGLRLAAALPIEATKTGRPIRAMHSFYEMNDGSYLAFFEVVDPFDQFVFEPRSDFDLHIALTVPDMHTLDRYKQRAVERDVDVRGPADHGLCRSVYLRDPDGYVIELTVLADDHDQQMQTELELARSRMDAWQNEKLRSER